MNNYQPRAPHPERTAAAPCHTTVHATSCNAQLTPGDVPGRAKHLDGSPYPEGVVFFEGEVAAPAGGQLIDPAVASRGARNWQRRRTCAPTGQVCPGGVARAVASASAASARWRERMSSSAG